MYNKIYINLIYHQQPANNSTSAQADEDVESAPTNSEVPTIKKPKSVKAKVTSIFAAVKKSVAGGGPNSKDINESEVKVSFLITLIWLN